MNQHILYVALINFLRVPFQGKTFRLGRKQNKQKKDIESADTSECGEEVLNVPKPYPSQDMYGLPVEKY